MDINKLLDTIDRGLRDIHNEVLANLDVKVKAQRTKPVETRLADLEALVARMRSEVSSMKSSITLYEMRVESARHDASQALAEIRALADLKAREPGRSNRSR